MFANKQVTKHPIIKPNITLTKFKSSYDKLEKEMNKPLSEYDEIKQHIEMQNNSIANIQNNINKNSKKLPLVKSKNKNKNLK